MVRVPLYGVYDFTLHSRTEHGNSFRVQLDATFEHVSGARLERVPGFYNGDHEYVVRFSPTLEGQWRGRTTSEDSWLDGIRLDPITVTPKVTARARGVIGIDPANPQRFSWQDGTPCMYLGFECDWLFSYHQRDPARCAKHIRLVADRGFTAIVMNVYAHTGFSTDTSRFEGIVLPGSIYGPPDLYAFGGTNDEPDHTRLNVDFFREYDEVIAQLHELGIVAHLMIQVQNKHVNWPDRGTPEDDAYWRYVVARYQAFGNVIWDVGKESYNLLAETGSHDYALSRITLIRNADAYGHLVTVHDSEAQSAGRTSESDAACDFVSDQIHLADTGNYNREAIRKQQLYARPYLNIEYGYELGAEDLRTYRSRTTVPWQQLLEWTYALYAAGAYACYYYSNTSWDLIKFEPEPEGWSRYKILSDLLARLPFNDMGPNNVLVEHGYCLADPGRAYLVYLPHGGDANVDLTAVPCPRAEGGQPLPSEEPITVNWTNITTGERRDDLVYEWGWSTPIANPFEDTSAAVAVTIVRA